MASALGPRWPTPLQPALAQSFNFGAELQPGAIARSESAGSRRQIDRPITCHARAPVIPPANHQPAPSIGPHTEIATARCADRPEPRQLRML